ncbi:hypothetical protein [Streptomyces luteogriseus]|uniref:hypothetical protein n=1 Tax=Streptomyces luteogriseus TaxID=68233 RepID=UPI003723836C
MQGNGDRTGANRRFGVRDRLGIAVCVLCLVVGVGVVLLLMGLWKQLARETIPTPVELPGGPWALGAVLGVITVLGALGGLRSASAVPGGSVLVQALRTGGTAACCAAAFGPFYYLLSGLPTKNCRSANCAYVPGTGTAFLAYVVAGGLVALIVHRWTSARAAERVARERERARKLRKKGKGKTRTA